MALPKLPAAGTAGGKPVRLFTTAQVARLLRTTPHEIRRVIRAVGLKVQRRRRRIFVTFRDLVVLRAALKLRRQSVPLRRLGVALRKLRQELPQEQSVSGVRLWAQGDEVLAQRGPSFWSVESGQLVFPFAVEPRNAHTPSSVATLAGTTGADPERAARASEAAAERWYSLAVAREEAGDLAGARQAYLRALRYDPNLSDACVNLGRLAHQAGRFQQAAEWYRRALQSSPDDPIAHYDLAIALEDLGDFAAAIREYQRALRANWDFPEAHFNLSRLYRATGRVLEAARHLRIYRRLTGKPS